MASIFMLGMNDKAQSLQHMVNKSNPDALVLYFLILSTSCIIIYTRFLLRSRSHWQEENELFLSAIIMIMKCVTCTKSAHFWTLLMSFVGTGLWNVIKSSLRWKPEVSVINISAGTYGKCPCLCYCRYIRKSNPNPMWILGETNSSSFHLQWNSLSVSHVIFSNWKKCFVQKIWCNSITFLVSQTVPVHPGPFQKWAGYTAYAGQTDPFVDQVNPTSIYMP